MKGGRRRGKSSATPLEVRRAFGLRLQQRRRQLGWSQGDLGRRIGTLGTRLSKLENGHTAPRLGELVRLHDALSMSLDELIAGEPSAQTPAQVGLRRLEQNLSPDQGLLVGIILNSIASELKARGSKPDARGGVHDRAS